MVRCTIPLVSWIQNNFAPLRLVKTFQKTHQTLRFSLISTQEQEIPLNQHCPHVREVYYPFPGERFAACVTTTNTLQIEKSNHLAAAGRISQAAVRKWCRFRVSDARGIFTDDLPRDGHKNNHISQYIPETELMVLSTKSGNPTGGFTGLARWEWGSVKAGAHSSPTSWNG